MLDTDKSKYTITVQEMEEEYGVKLNFDNIVFYKGREDEIKQAIRDYFYFREIGYDTIGRFNFRFNERLRRLMPVFNKLYALDDAMGEYANWFENANYKVTQDNTETFGENYTRAEDATEAQTGKDVGASKETSTSQTDMDKTEDSTAHGETGNDSTSNTTGTNKVTNSGTDTSTISGLVEEGGTTSNTGTSTRDSTTDSTTTDQKFKVLSSLPQDMVKTSDIQDNIWASAAAKEYNTLRGNVTANETGSTTGSIEHGKTVDTDSTTTAQYGKIIDGENSSYNVGHSGGTSDANSKVDTTGTSKTDAEENLTTQLDLVRDTDFKRNLTDAKNNNTVGNLQKLVRGNIGHKYIVELVPMMRAAILNIPSMIIAELESLFFGLW